jgi:hypothetical protein
MAAFAGVGPGAGGLGGDGRAAVALPKVMAH